MYMYLNGLCKRSAMPAHRYHIYVCICMYVGMWLEMQAGGKVGPKYVNLECLV